MMLCCCISDASYLISNFYLQNDFFFFLLIYRITMVSIDQQNNFCWSKLTSICTKISQLYVEN